MSKNTIEQIQIQIVGAGKNSRTGEEKKKEKKQSETNIQNN